MTREISHALIIEIKTSKTTTTTTTTTQQSAKLNNNSCDNINNINPI